MRFQVLSDEELLNLLPEGNYPFTVKSAQDVVSKTGSEMIKLQLSVHDNSGRERTVYDYLLEALAYKIKHFAQAVGIEDKYDAGGYEARDCIGKSGVCKIGKQEAQGQYQAKNVCLDYIKRDPNDPQGGPGQVPPDAFKDDQDITF